MLIIAGPSSSANSAGKMHKTSGNVIFTATVAARSSAFCVRRIRIPSLITRMSVREWNEEAEYDAKRNPDTEGQEPDFDKGPHNIDDVPDWKALIRVPGHYPYPSFPIAK